MQLPHASLADHEWLASSAARPWLEQAAREHAISPALSPAVLTRWRTQLGVIRAPLVLELAQLRAKAREKFLRAPDMVFTRRGLEQATDELLAACKAARFPAGQPLFDLCCGIGGDLLGLACRGPVTGIDLDPVMAVYSRANLSAAGHNPLSAGVRIANAADVAVEESAAWHIDPDRRGDGRRTVQIDLIQPGQATLDSLRARNPHLACKLAPATLPPSEWQEAAEFEWFSSRGECRQLVAWFGNLGRHPGHRTATRVLPLNPAASGGSGVNLQPAAGASSARPGALFQSFSFTGPAGPATAGTRPAGHDAQAAVAAQPARYLIEPDPAVLAAGLASSLAAARGLQWLAENVPYWTGDQFVPDPLLTSFEVLDVLPMDMKKLRAWVRARGIGHLEVKKRGVPHDPEKIRQALRMPGDRSVTLLVARLATGVQAIFAQRVSGALGDYRRESL